MWGNVPRAYSRYTVARHTPSRFATSRMVSSRPGMLALGGAFAYRMERLDGPGRRNPSIYAGL